MSNLLLSPSDEPTADLVLVPQDAAPEVKDNEAQSFVKPVDEESRGLILATADSFSSNLKTVNVNSPEFAKEIREIETIAQAEILASGSGTNRLLERSVASSKKNGSDTTNKVVGTLADLRSTVSELTPNAADLTGVRKILGFIPGGKKVRRYFQKYESAQVQLDNIVKSLISGQDELRKDNASLQQEKVTQWEMMGQINQYIVLTEEIDKRVSAQIAELKSAGRTQEAGVLETEMLFTVRQRHQDLLTQLAVSIQSYMAMEMIRKNNIELIKGVERARTTTITALRNAMLTAQALDTQELVLDQLDAVKASTEKAILATAEMMKKNTGRIHEQASSPAVSVAVLEQSFSNIFATLDEIESFKVKANDSMAVSIGTLTNQLERARPQLEKARALEGNGDNSGSTRAINS